MRLIYVRSSQLVLPPGDDEDAGISDTTLTQAAELVARFGPGRVFIDRLSTHARPELHRLVGYCVCNPQPPEAGAEVCARDLTRFGVPGSDGAHAFAVVAHLERAGYRVRLAEHTRDTPHD